MPGTFLSIPAIDMSQQARHRTPLGGFVSTAELLNALIASNRMAPAIFARGERVLYGPARVGM
jgi:hypothetical protein